MTTTLSLNRLAGLAYDNYYASEINDENTLHEYIENAFTPEMQEKTTHTRLTQALNEDIHDLLNNGNDEDLGWSEEDTESLRDGDYYDNLSRLSSLLAAKIISRIYT